MCHTFLDAELRKAIAPCAEERCGHARLVLVVNEVRQFRTYIQPLMLPITVESCVVGFMIYKGALSTIERRRFFQKVPDTFEFQYWAGSIADMPRGSAQKIYNTDNYIYTS